MLLDPRFFHFCTSSTSRKTIKLMKRKWHLVEEEGVRHVNVNMVSLGRFEVEEDYMDNLIQGCTGQVRQLKP